MVDYYSEGTGDGPKTDQAENRDGSIVEGMQVARPVVVEKVRKGFFLLFLNSYLYRLIW